MTAEQKLSKIETLRMAQAYIKTLAGLVQSDMASDVDHMVSEVDHSEALTSDTSSSSIDAVEIDMFELISQG